MVRWRTGDFNSLDIPPATSDDETETYRRPNISPPTSDDETETHRPRRHAAPSSTYRTGTSDYHSSQSSSSNDNFYPGGLRRQAAISSATQSSSSRSRGHSFQSHSSTRPSSIRDMERTIRSTNSFDRGPDKLNRTLRERDSRIFEPQSGTDMSSYDTSYGSYGSQTSTIRGNNSSRSRSEFFDVSSAEGTPSRVHRAQALDQFNERRRGYYGGSSYGGSSDDHRRAREDSSTNQLTRAFNDSSLDDDYS